MTSAIWNPLPPALSTFAPDMQTHATSLHFKSTENTGEEIWRCTNVAKEILPQRAADRPRCPIWEQRQGTMERSLHHPFDLWQTGKGSVQKKGGGKPGSMTKGLAHMTSANNFGISFSVSKFYNTEICCSC